MRKKACLLLLLAAFAPALHASDGDTLVRFDGAIGVIPVSNVGVNADGTFANVSRNIVRGVNPATDLGHGRTESTVRVDGRIRVRGRGLLLGGGNNIGLNGNARVFATLICGAAAPFTLHSTTLAGVPLEPNGDFRIDDEVSPVPVACPAPVLLIRSAGNQNWFAAGIPKFDNDD
jgi:hypothetical protein